MNLLPIEIKYKIQELYTINEFIEMEEIDEMRLKKYIKRYDRGSQRLNNERMKMIIARRGKRDQEEVKVLIKYLIDPKYIIKNENVNGYSFTMLSYSCYKDNRYITDQILKYRVEKVKENEERIDINYNDYKSYSALYWVCVRGDINTLYRMMENGVKMTTNILHGAYIGGHIEIIEYLKEKGVKEEYDKYGMLPIDKAIHYGRVGIVEEKIGEYEEIINEETPNGNLRLLYAIESGEERMIDILINKGADKDKYCDIIKGSCVEYVKKNEYFHKYKKKFGIK